MKKALILGALAGQVDAIDALKQRGVETHACGHLRSGPGVRAADHFHLVDITDADAVALLASRISADIVYSVGSDIAMPTVVDVSERLGLPSFHGPELTSVLRSKELLRARLGAAGLSPVQYVSVGPDENLPVWSAFPAIVKPVDAQGQRGITIVHRAEEMPGAIEVAKDSSVSGAVIVEELLVGPEVSAHVLARDGEVLFYAPSDRHVWEGPLVGIPSAHSIPLRSETAIWSNEFLSLIKSVAQALEIREGPLYVQAIFTERGPRIIEIASRLDGCHLWRMLKHATGIDIMDAVLSRLLGDPWPDFPEKIVIQPTTLEFFLGDPSAKLTRDDVSRIMDKKALFAEMQLEDDGSPRRTNDVVARLGYRIVPGVP